MKIVVPELCLVVLVGTSGSGKSTFARKHFKPTEVLSSDFCRGLVSDNENDQAATPDAFAVLNFIAAKRLTAGRLTVIDATNVQPDSRKPLVALAREHHCIPVAIVLNLPERICQDRNKSRTDRNFGNHVIHQQNDQLRRSLRGLEREGFRHVFVLSSEEEIEAVTIERQPLWNNLKHEHGPFDIIGDVHGCFAELEQLLTNLGYAIKRNLENDGAQHFDVVPPAGRKAVFLGDLVDRGPGTPDVLKLVMSMVRSGAALCVPGNHDMKLMRKLKGRDVKITHGLAESLEQLDKESQEFRRDVADFLDKLVSHYVLDEGNLVVAHAGMKERFQGRGSEQVRSFALYGETTGETDEFGLPVRYNWAADYRGQAFVVYGHTPVPQPEWLNKTVNIDTGCVFGGRLTALRYPEKELVSVNAAKMYYAPAKPLVPVPTPDISPNHEADSQLSLDDVCGKRIIETRLHGKITIREQNSAAALEVMSRFAADPNWLIYLPPTMSPTETSDEPALLEHPSEAFAYFRDRGINSVVCEEKHMGSRAIVVICKSNDAARKRFRVNTQGVGICYTRTGRPFFNDASVEAAFLDRISNALTKSDFWSRFQTDWLALDCELMPWSAKAQELLKEQYAAVGVGGTIGLAATVAALEQACNSGRDCHDLLNRHQERLRNVRQFVDAYRKYCWTVKSVDDLKLAPFHVLASEGVVHADKDHVWHMRELATVAANDESSLIIATRCKHLDLTDEDSVQSGIAWWHELTVCGGEGMVVKPLDFVSRGAKGLIQPAIKVRGREYLRIIYGPEYTAQENLKRLRARHVNAKRSLALREFSLGIEALERFVRHEPLYKVHECVFGVLALESEPVDPRL